MFALFYGAIAVFAYVRTHGLRAVLRVAATQTLFTGVHARPLVSLAALTLGTLIITQANEYPIDVADLSAHILVEHAIPMIVAFIIAAAPASTWAALLFLPYLAWVGFATALNWRIFQMNGRRPAGSRR